MTEPPTTLERELLPCYRAVAPRFRGEIWESAAQVPMAVGYNNGGKPFDIETACYLKPVFRAIKNRDTRKVVIKAAVQTLKTRVVEEAIAYFFEHETGDIGFYLSDIDAASDHAKGRFLPWLKSIPGVAVMLAGCDRFNVTTTELVLPHKSLRIWPLNESATQRITLRLVAITDAFLSKKSGLIRHAIARTTQHERDCKVLIESQGSNDGDDFDTQFNETDQGELHIVCPLCSTGQPFEWQRYREDNFTPVFNGMNDPPVARAYSGMQRGEAAAYEDGKINEAGVLRETHYECYHCGGRIEDTPANRQALDRSSYYVAKNPRALPGNSGFNWPAWINTRISWGKIMLEYLRAKEADRLFGNRLPLIEWTQKRAAKTWRDDLYSEITIRTTESYDPLVVWKDKKWRWIWLIVDCQQELAFFWHSVFVINPDGEVCQLSRGMLNSFADIEAKQKEFEIPDQWVFLDGGYRQDDLIEVCAKHGHYGRLAGRRAPVWLCWTLLKGSGLDGFSHRDDKNVRIRHVVSDPSVFMPEQTSKDRTVLMYQFAKLHACDQARRYRDADNAPKCNFLPETESPNNELSWTAQLHAHWRKMDVNARTGVKVPIWKPKKQGIPDHGWDILTMLMALLNLFKVGAAAPPPAEPVAAGLQAAELPSEPANV